MPTAVQMTSATLRRTTLAVALLLALAHARTVDFEADAGAVAGDSSLATCQKNGALLNTTLAALKPGDTLLVPNKTFHLMGGVRAVGLTGSTFRLDGTIVWSSDMDAWPRSSPGKDGRVLECLHFIQCSNLTITSGPAGLHWTEALAEPRTLGTMDGQGKAWWGIPGVGYLQRGENRPRMLNLERCTGVLVENIFMKEPPYWTFWANRARGLEVRNSHIDARRDSSDSHDVYDLTAYNTDGFDVSGDGVWIHDCSVWNQDDCVCAKDGSSNMLFERINASGVGLAIGSIGGSKNRNITFRDCRMHHTYKGIYMKFRHSGGTVEDVLYENIVIDEPEQWGIWIGPAQQSDSDNLCAAHPCSLCWPTLPWAKCGAPAAGLYVNVTLRNVTVNNPKSSPGVILGNASNPMQNLVLDNVVVNGGGDKPWGHNYYCPDGGVQGTAVGGTSPVPDCFKIMHAGGVVGDGRTD